MQRSAWWIIYRLDNSEPKFLVLKRQSLSKVVEWVAPKWKIEFWETPAQAAIREIWEEVGIDACHLKNKWKLGDLYINLKSAEKGNFEKNIEFFLFEFSGSKDGVQVQSGEGYVGFYKWATISDVLSLIHFENLRELFRKGYKIVKQEKTFQDSQPIQDPINLISNYDPYEEDL